jgi:hypothetical protein
MTNISESFASTNTGPGTTVTTAFDAYSQLQNDNISAGSFAYQAAFSRDSAGRRSQLGFGAFGYNYTWRADGLLASVNGLTGGGSYSYDTAGQLSTRTVPPMVATITQRDGAGRPLAAGTTINGSSVFTENLAYTGDGLLATDTMFRPDFTDGRSYSYAPQSRRLTQEILNLSTNVTWTNTFAFDSGSTGGPGVLTHVGNAPGSPAATWNGGTDAFSRISSETNSTAQRQAFGYTAGPATVSALVNGKPMPVTTVGTNWSTELELAPGSNQLVVNAVNWSGLYAASATNSFTNNAADRVVNTFSGDGELTNRVWYNSFGYSNRTQSLSWDAKGRLHGVTDLDTNGNGYSWNAVYDGLDRRLQTITTLVTNGISATNSPNTISQFYDPAVRFLELAVAVNGVTTWKIYGPDANGTYGGMSGVGGFDATGTIGQYASPIISDMRGNGYALYQQNSLNWYSSRVTAYNAVPGYRPLPLANGADLAHSSAWRGKWVDPMQTCQLGKRPYGLVGSYWLSADPLSHDADPSLYAFCAALNPVGAFDPTGMCSDGASGGKIPAWLQYILSQPNARQGTDYAWSSDVAPSSSGFSAGQFAADAVLNATPIQQAWGEVTSPDFSTGIGITTFGVAAISLTANILNAGGNILTLGELTVGENAVKTGLMDLVRGGAEGGTAGETMLGGSFANLRSMRNVNPLRDTLNCGECAVYGDDILAGGNATVAGKSGLTDLSSFEKIYGQTWSSPISGSSALSESIGSLPVGSRGLVFGMQEGSDVGHYFNFVNTRAGSVFLDFQKGAAISPGNFSSFRLLQTH